MTYGKGYIGKFVKNNKKIFHCFKQSSLFENVITIFFIYFNKVAKCFKPNSCNIQMNFSKEK